jgi:hypothetical protein
VEPIKVVLYAANVLVLGLKNYQDVINIAEVGRNLVLFG